MSEEFRALERPRAERKKDFILMATVSSFEGLDHPTKSELRQFAELFSPLFQASSEEAKRQAVAALSQCTNVPPAVASFVACQPISIAAPFLTASPCLDDDLLIMVARTQGAAHARAIVRRETLSPAVIDALVGLRHSERAHDMPSRTTPLPSAETPPIAPPVAKSSLKQMSDRITRTVIDPTAASIDPVAAPAGDSRDEDLRDRLKRLARHIHRPATDRLGMRTLSPVQEALLVRFARTREPHHFATTLTDALSASRWLSERIMLDISGRQLALTLTGLGMGHEDAISVLIQLYPHLRKKSDGVLRAEALLTELNPAECHDRVEAWRRADRYTYARDEAADMPAGTKDGLREASRR